MALVFPAFDPIFFSLGPLTVRWYALAYVAGFVLGWRLCMRLAGARPAGGTAVDYDDFLTWVIIGTILGGRLGYILFYQFDFYMNAPQEILEVWHGGMSFHGGMMGVIAAAWIFTKRRKLSFFGFTDMLACVTPIGLFLGRLANFVNGELFGRPTDVSWGMVFPRGGEFPRHPSQLYEAGAEGVVLFLILMFLVRLPYVRQHYGFLSGAFLAGYGALRFGVEFFREPDAQLGFLFAGATMGQLLCVPMILAGVFLIVRAMRRPAVLAP